MNYNTFRGATASTEATIFQSNADILSELSQSILRQASNSVNVTVLLDY